MKRTSLIVILFFSCLRIYSQDTISGKIIIRGEYDSLNYGRRPDKIIDSIPCPKNIDESNKFLDSIFHNETKEYIKTQTESDFINTNLYRIEKRWHSYFSCLSNFFWNKYAFNDPYIMELILKSYYRYLKKIELQIESEIKLYKTKEKNIEYISDNEYKERRERIYHGDFSKNDIIRHINNLNDSSYIITIDFYTGNAFGLARYVEYLPCNCNYEIINNGRSSSQKENNNILMFMWLNIPNIDKIELKYKLYCNIEKKEIKNMFGQLMYLNDNLRISIDIKNADD